MPEKRLNSRIAVVALSILISGLNSLPSSAQLLNLPGIMDSEQVKRLNNIFKEINTTPQGHAGALVPSLLESLSGLDRRALSEVYPQVRDILQDPSVIYALVQSLKGESAEIASGLLANSKNYGSDFDLNKTEIEDIIIALGSENDTVRKNLAQLLGTVTPPQDSGIHAALIRLLTNDPQSQVRMTAASSLGNLAREAYFKNTAPIAEAFGKVLLEDPSAQVRAAAAGALAQMGGKAEPAAAAICKALSDNSSQVRYQVIQAVINIGPPCANAVNELIDMYNGPSEVYRTTSKERIVTALAAIGPVAADKTVPLLIQLLGDHTTAASAARSLSSFGPAAEKSVPELTKLLQSAYSADRDAAARALAAIGPKAASALAALKKASLDERHAEGEHYSSSSSKQAARDAILKIAGDDAS